MYATKRVDVEICSPVGESKPLIDQVVSLVREEDFWDVKRLYFRLTSFDEDDQSTEGVVYCTVEVLLDSTERNTNAIMDVTSKMPERWNLTGVETR